MVFGLGALNDRTPRNDPEFPKVPKFPNPKSPLNAQTPQPKILTSQNPKPPSSLDSRP